MDLSRTALFPSLTRLRLRLRCRSLLRCLRLWCRSESRCLSLSFRWSFVGRTSLGISAILSLTSVVSRVGTLDPSTSIAFAPVTSRGVMGSPSARDIASSSASLIFLISSRRSRASLSSSVSPESAAAGSALAYQFRSRPFAQRPTGALRLWPR